MAGGLREARQVVVVILDFVVPSVDGVNSTDVARSQVFAVRAAGVDQLHVVAVELLRVVGCEFSQGPVPSHCGRGVKRSFFVGLVQDVLLELIE